MFLLYSILTAPSHIEGKASAVSVLTCGAGWLFKTPTKQQAQPKKPNNPKLNKLHTEPSKTTLQYLEAP